MLKTFASCGLVLMSLPHDKSEASIVKVRFVHFRRYAPDAHPASLLAKSQFFSITVSIAATF